jgi:hypothetical protein
MKKVIFLSVIAILLAACGPSQGDIQTATARTQAALTPAPGSIASPTINPCPDRGWNEIETYLKQFNLVMKSLENDTNSSAESYMNTFDSFRDKVSLVEVDTCSDHARKSIVDGMTKEINAMQIVASGYARIDAAPVFIEGVSLIDEGINELAGLGIQLDYK